MIRKDGSSERYAFGSGIPVDKCDVIRVITGAGGGVGDPRERDRTMGRDDIRNGYITVERAREIYGAS